MSSIYISVTAYNPLSRIETLLEVLKGYETLDLDKEIDITIDHEHAYDLDEFSLIVAGNTNLRRVSFTVASPEYVGYSLCWAHKPSLAYQIVNKKHDYYMYSENDILFTKKQFDYWIEYKDVLKEENLEPGFCRVEKVKDKFIPFDNYRRWNLSGVTSDVWGPIGYNCGFKFRPAESGVIGFTTLGNPYGGFMIMDQEDSEKYIRSDSSHPVKSHAKIGLRNWPIADRSSMGLAFEKLLPGQEHRRAIPLINENGKIKIPECALVQHLDNKYSSALLKNSPMIDTDTMFTY